MNFSFDDGRELLLIGRLSFGLIFQNDDSWRDG